MKFFICYCTGYDILKIVQQFIRIYSALIFIYTTGPLRKALILFRLKRPFTSLKNLRDDSSVIDLIAGAKVIRSVWRATQV